MAAGLMYFQPTDKAKAVLKEWHQVCVDVGSNNQPAWNRVCPTCLSYNFLRVNQSRFVQ
jgi:hypothetical protein